MTGESEGMDALEKGLDSVTRDGKSSKRKIDHSEAEIRKSNRNIRALEEKIKSVDASVRKFMNTLAFNTDDARLDLLENIWTRAAATIQFTNNADTLKLQYDSSKYATFEVNSAGDISLGLNGSNKVIINAVGGNMSIGAASSASARLHLISTTEQLRLGYDVSNYGKIIVNSASELNFYVGPLLHATLDTSGRMGVGVSSSIGARVHALSTTEQLRLGYDATNYLSFTTDSAGRVNIVPTGAGIGFNTTPAAYVHILKTTEQFRLGYDASFYTSFTIDSAGILKIAPIGGHLYLQKVAAGSTHLNIIPNGANDGKLFIYSSDVLADATNYELFELFKSNAGNAKIKVSKGGTGTYRNLELYTNNALQVTLDTSGNLGVGVSASIGARVHALSTTEQLRLAYSSTVDTSFTVASSGDTTIKLNDGINLNFDLAGNESGGDFNFYSPDAIGSRINFFAYDSGSAKQKYATVNMYIADSTAGSEDGGIELKVVVAGSETPIVAIAGAGLTMNTGAVFLKSYTVAGVPSASVAGGMIYVSNETGGATPAFSDGTNWRRTSDRAIIA